MSNIIQFPKQNTQQNTQQKQDKLVFLVNDMFDALYGGNKKHLNQSIQNLSDYMFYNNLYR